MVLPKAMRERLNLKGKGRVRAEICDDKIELMADDEGEDEVMIVLKGKRRVITGVKNFDAVKAIQEAREEREEMLLAYRNQGKNKKK